MLQGQAILIVMTASIMGALFLGIFVIEMWKQSFRTRDFAKDISELRKTIQHYEKATLSIVPAIVSLEQLISVQRAVLDEVIDGGDEKKLETASAILFSQRFSAMKLVHHAGLINSNEEDALKSSWALATEFGEFDTVELMWSMEPYRSKSRLSVFQQHRAILTERIAQKFQIEPAP